MNSYTVSKNDAGCDEYPVLGACEEGVFGGVTNCGDLAEESEAE